MSKSTVSRAIALCGTEQPDVVGRILTAGPISVEFDNGQLRYLRLNGVEILRVVHGSQNIQALLRREGLE